MRLDILAYVAAWAAALSLLAGCSSSAGWRVEFGVSPVNSLENTAQFRQVERAEGNVKAVGERRY
jgi:hypothetical protein